jgi:CAAX prenyl protease-like protein
MSSPAFARCAPFVVYMAFIALEQALRYLAGKGFLPLSEASLLYLYPVKVVTVAILLVVCLKRCDELSFSDFKNLPATVVSTIVGLVVFILWINMEWTFGSSGPPTGYDPYRIQDMGNRSVLIAFRIAGASLVVPLMEELFWRSFLLRYLIKTDFTTVAVGTFTWGSFVAVAVLFGLEHNYIIAGVMAGVAYNLLAVYTRSIAQCVLSHGVTNLVLGIYVLTTGKWQFW